MSYKIWCNTCKKYHVINAEDDIPQYENWGCTLDFNDINDNNNDNNNENNHDK